MQGTKMKIAPIPWQIGPWVEEFLPWDKIP